MKLERSHRKGIILAGGTGSRLYPLTYSISKQLMAIYDKPMIYYPLCTFMSCGISKILIITNPDQKNLFQKLLGDGSHLGIDLKYEVQKEPKGIAQAFLIGSNFISNDNVALILGDNLFHGDNLCEQLKVADKKGNGGTIFAYRVKNPRRYGVVDFDSQKNIFSIKEKPKDTKSKYAVTGLYFYDNSIIEKARKVKSSERGELEITDINHMFLEEKNLKLEIFGRGTAWLDTGTFDSLQEAGSFIKTLENRQGVKIGCPEEVAWLNGWINNNQLENLAKPLIKSGYGKYLIELLN
tara:strand:+ start:44 stop:928 length:885 start_codon:yes stop_codon:yes gene_type:complete